jgi:hypothetical protein
MKEPFDVRQVEDRLRDIVLPAPSTELRARVQSVAVVAPPLTWSDQIWFSRRWRSAAAAIALAAVALNWIADRPTERAAAPLAQVIAEAKAIEDLAEQSGLPKAAAASLGRRALVPDSRPPMTAEYVSELLQGFEGEPSGGIR